MVPATVLLAAILELPIAAALLVVGGMIHRRSRRERQPALAWFAAFWVGIGTYGLAESLWALAYALGAQDLVVGLFVLHVKMIAMVAAFAGLVVYLLLLRDVERRLVAIVAGAYPLVLAVTATFYAWKNPVGQAPGVWGMRLEYARTSVEPWWTLILLLLFVPPLLAAVSYAALIRHAHDPATKYRILLVSGSLVAFFLPTLFAWMVGGWYWWGLVEKLAAAGMALAVVLAIWPPGRIRRWHAKRATSAPERERALAERARALV